MSFRLNGVGRLTASPKKGPKGDCQFSLLSNNDGRPGESRVFFVAFGSLGDSIAKDCHRGDELAVEAHHVQRYFKGRSGVTVQRYNNIVESFEIRGKTKQEED